MNFFPVQARRMFPRLARVLQVQPFSLFFSDSREVQHGDHMNRNQHEGEQGETAMYYEQAPVKSRAEPRGKHRAKQPPAGKVGYCNTQEAACKQQDRRTPEQQINDARTPEVTVPPEGEHRRDSHSYMHSLPGLGLPPRSAQNMREIV